MIVIVIVIVMGLHTCIRIAAVRIPPRHRVFCASVCIVLVRLAVYGIYSDHCSVHIVTTVRYI